MHSPFHAGAPVFRVVPIAGLLRERPTAVFWAATAAQAMLWLLVPSLFYASPPGDLPEVLAIGHQWQLGSWLGPPLAFWLAEIAFAAAGGHVIGVYALAQACVVGTFWAIYRLGRAVVGPPHATIAILLMTGVFALSVPTPEFGPNVLGMPLAALSLLLYWRAVGEGRRAYWLPLGFALGLMLFATYWAALLIALFAVFTFATARGRATLATIDPWAAAAIALLVPLPHWAWLNRGGLALLPQATPSVLLSPAIVAAIAASHLGLVALLVLAHAKGARRGDAIEIERPPTAPFARTLVLFFALAPLLAATAAAAILGHVSPSWAALLVLMSGLAVVVAAPDPLRLERPQILAAAWTAVLLLPAFVMLAAILLLPWVGISTIPGQEPAASMGRFFSDTFQRRVGRSLERVGGDLHVASLIALASPSRPGVYDAAAPARTPWTNEADMRQRGAILVWPIADSVGAPPTALRARFPELVAEVPQTFERPVQGWLPSIRIGWAVIRPQAAAR